MHDLVMVVAGTYRRLKTAMILFNIILEVVVVVGVCGRENRGEKQHQDAPPHCQGSFCC